MTGLIHRSAVLMGTMACTSVLAPASASADDAVVPEPEFQQLLLDVVSRQQEQIEAQRRALDDQEQRIEKLEDTLATIGPAGPQIRSANYQTPQMKDGGKPIKAGEGQSLQSAQTVGPEPPEDEGDVLREERFAGVAEQAGGILTSRGTLIFEPQIEYEQSSTNRFFFQGLEVASTVLVGQIEATDSDRDVITASASARYGITDRAEVELDVPYVVHGEDKVTRTIVGAGGDPIRRTIDNRGLGDVSVTGRYQINRAGTEWPVFVGSARFKSDTGEGPFEVGRDQNGVETELPTGSGFFGVEGGVTALYPSDPVVFFAQTTYLYHIARDIDEMIGGSQIGRVDPGDVVGMSFGMGFGVNERTSFTLGYKHNFVMPTTTEINGTDTDSESFDVGALLLGFTFAATDRITVNLNVEAGVTEDAPDVRMLLRVPVRFDLLGGSGSNVASRR